jgi:hypothetical protein
MERMMVHLDPTRILDVAGMVERPNFEAIGKKRKRFFRIQQDKKNIKSLVEPKIYDA